VLDQHGFLFGVMVDLLLILLGISIGFFIYSLYQNFYNAIKSEILLRESEKSALLLLVSAAESIAFLQTIKYKTMEEYKVNNDTIKKTKQIDDYNFTAWKRSVINNLLNVYPKSLRKRRYIDWDSAMKLLDQVYIKSHRE